MNLDDKLKLAHEYLRDIISNWNYDASFDPVAESWQYADAMEAEYNKRKVSGFPDALIMTDSPQLEFQPDWSQAPEWANYWVKTSGKSHAWLGDKPSISNIVPHWNIECIKKQLAPSFNYQGDWKDSLRKRPEEPKEQKYKCNCAHWKNSTCFMGDTFKCGDCGGMVTI